MREHKSVGREVTFPQDISQREQLETVLFTLTDDVCHTLRENHLKGKTVSIKIRYPDFHSITRAVTLSQYTANFEPVACPANAAAVHYPFWPAVRWCGRPCPPKAAPSFRRRPS